MLVQIKSAFKSFGSQELFKDLNLIIQENEKVALIGANGVGKTIDSIREAGGRFTGAGTMDETYRELNQFASESNKGMHSIVIE
ncbi:hypothetical protein PT113_09285, partial [Erysipelothrix rhusiopathiae]|nr:hypothetical protein [Erysipelothrix rhusiopathiae]